MSPEQNASRLREIATRTRGHYKLVIAAELALQGLDPARDAIVFGEQVEAVSELLQDIAHQLDEQAAGIMHTVERQERAA